MPPTFDMEKVKADLRSVLVSSSEGLDERILIRDFHELAGYGLPYRDFGFNRLIECLRAWPDVVQIQERYGVNYFYCQADEKTMRIASLVQGQKKKDRKNKSGRGGRSYIPPRAPYQPSGRAVHYNGMIHSSSGHRAPPQRQPVPQRQAMPLPQSMPQRQAIPQRQPVPIPVEVLQSVKKLLQEQQFRYGINILNFKQTYNMFSSSGPLQFEQYGFINVMEFLRSIPNIAKIKQIGTAIIVENSESNATEVSRTKTNYSSKLPPRFAGKSASNNINSTSNSASNNINYNSASNNINSNTVLNNITPNTNSLLNNITPNTNSLLNNNYPNATTSTKPQQLSNPKPNRPATSDIKMLFGQVLEKFPNGLNIEDFIPEYESHTNIKLDLESIGYFNEYELVEGFPEIFNPIKTEVGTRLYHCKYKRTEPLVQVSQTQSSVSCPSPLVPSQIIKNFELLLRKHPKGIVVCQINELYSVRFKEELATNMFKEGFKDIEQFLRCLAKDLPIEIVPWSFDASKNILQLTHQSRANSHSPNLTRKETNLTTSPVPTTIGLTLNSIHQNSIEEFKSPSPALAFACKPQTPKIPSVNSTPQQSNGAMMYPEDAVTEVESYPQIDFFNVVNIEDYFPILVSQIRNPGDFYFQLKMDNDANLNELAELMEDLRYFYFDSENFTEYRIPDNFNVFEGMICAAPYNDGMWYRAQIANVVQPDVFTVFYIDCGSLHNVNKSAICFLKREYLTLPAQALPAKLACIESPQKGSWPNESRKRFIELALNNLSEHIDRVIQAKFYDLHDERTISLMLCDTNPEVEIHINEQLTKDGFATLEVIDDENNNEIYEEEDNYSVKEITEPEPLLQTPRNSNSIQTPPYSMQTPVASTNNVLNMSGSSDASHKGLTASGGKRLDPRIVDYMKKKINRTTSDQMSDSSCSPSPSKPAKKLNLAAVQKVLSSQEPRPEMVHTNAENFTAVKTKATTAYNCPPGLFSPTSPELLELQGRYTQKICLNGMYFINLVNVRKQLFLTLEELSSLIYRKFSCELLSKNLKFKGVAVNRVLIQRNCCPHLFLELANTVFADEEHVPDSVQLLPIQCCIRVLQHMLCNKQIYEEWKSQLEKLLANFNANEPYWREFNQDQTEYQRKMKTMNSQLTCLKSKCCEMSKKMISSGGEISYVVEALNKTEEDIKHIKKLQKKIESDYFKRPNKVQENRSPSPSALCRQFLTGGVPVKNDTIPDNGQENTSATPRNTTQIDLSPAQTVQVEAARPILSEMNPFIPAFQPSQQKRVPFEQSQTCPPMSYPKHTYPGWSHNA